MCVCVCVYTSVGWISYFLILAGSGFHKTNYKRFQFSLFNFVFKTYTQGHGINIFILKNVIDSHDACSHSQLWFGGSHQLVIFFQIKNKTKITNKLFILLFFLKNKIKSSSWTLRVSNKNNRGDNRVILQNIFDTHPMLRYTHMQKSYQGFFF
jgi:hypothetical protein